VRSHQAEAPVCECGAKDQVSRAGASVSEQEGTSLGQARRGAVLLVLTAVVVVALAGSGCSKPKPVELQPKVLPPVVKEAGVLRAGIDLEYPPFGGTDNGAQAGLDLDVAAALAERLGLKLVAVQVSPSEAATELANGAVDVVLSVPFSAEALSNVTLAGSYIADAEGFFVATEDTAPVKPTMTIRNLPVVPPAKVGAQKGSPAYWELLHELGPEGVQEFATLRKAIEALEAGQVPVIAGDTLVGGYIARDYPTVHFAGQLDSATLLGVGVVPDNTKLASATRDALDGLAADGVLDAIRVKWLGNVPKLKVAVTDPAAETSASPTP